MKKILIAGGTGLIGKRLTSMAIDAGYQVHILSRRMFKSNENIQYFVWDVPNHYIDERAFEGVNHIINLSGSNIGSKKWSQARKKNILDSRTASTKLLFDYVKTLAEKQTTYITSSAVGYYGGLSSEHIFVETDPPAQDFLGEVCQKWEMASKEFETIQIRTAQVRTGVVFDAQGGAFPKILKPIKMGIGAILGNGEQYIPWIHLEDICRLYLFIIENSLEGAFNGVAPETTTNAELTKHLALKLGKKIWLPPIPKRLLSLVLGEMSQLVTEGSRASCSKVLDSGFTFQYPTLEKALDSLL